MDRGALEAESLDMAREPLCGDSPFGVDSASYVVSGKSSTVPFDALLTWAPILSGYLLSVEYGALMNAPGCLLIVINLP